MSVQILYAFLDVMVGLALLGGLTLAVIDRWTR